MTGLSDSFFSLDASRVLEAVDSALPEDAESTGYMLALNSLENRVFQIDLEGGSQVVAKFYRPDRWTEEQITEEHVFIKQLDEAEIPVVPFISLRSGLSGCQSLGQTEDGIFFSIAPRVRGRLMDELDETRLESLGRYLARMHNVGESFSVNCRAELSIESYGEESLDFLMNSEAIDETLRPHYKQAAQRFLDLARPRLESLESFLVHGDFHLGNCLWDDYKAFVIDFDDCLVAPPVQDIWMIIRGRDQEAIEARESLLSGYEQFRDFDYSSIQAIEALRGLRILRYSAWIAQRWSDPSFPKAFPSFRTQKYWQEEVRALYECSEILELH